MADGGDAEDEDAEEEVADEVRAEEGVDGVVVGAAAADVPALNEFERCAGADGLVVEDAEEEGRRTEGDDIDSACACSSASC